MIPIINQLGRRPSVSRCSRLGLAICATSRRPAEALDARLTRPGRMDRWLRWAGLNGRSPVVGKSWENPWKILRNPHWMVGKSWNILRKMDDQGWLIVVFFNDFGKPEKVDKYGMWMEDVVFHGVSWNFNGAWLYIRLDYYNQGELSWGFENQTLHSPRSNHKW